MEASREARKQAGIQVPQACPVKAAQGRHAGVKNQHRHQGDPQQQANPGHDQLRRPGALFGELRKTQSHTQL